MGTFTLILALFCTFCWISNCEFRTAEVQPGQEVTLLCSNFTRFPDHVSWFRLANVGPNASRISAMIDSNGITTSFAGFDNGKFTMTSNNSHIFLKINPVITSDSGLYFCGPSKDRNPVIISGTYLIVEVALYYLMSMILGAVAIVLTLVIICLIVQIRTSHRVQDKRSEQHIQNQDSDTLNYAALQFQSREQRHPRVPADSKLDLHVVYATTR